MECISVDVKNNWALKLGNLRRLKKALDKYLEQELKISNSRFDRIDLPSLARKSQPEDIVKLFENILYAILNCPSKTLYITRIMELEESVQVQLMFFIQKLMREDEDNLIQDSDLLQREHEKLKSEKRKLVSQVTQLEQDLASVTEEKSRLTLSLEQLRDENSKLYSDISRKSVQEEKISSVFVNELKSRLNEKDQEISGMQHSIDQIKRKYENEISQLKDDLDVAQAKIYQNINADKTMQQYKKRLENLAGIKQKADDLQKQNENLMETVNSQLSQIDSLSTYKKQVVMLKEQVTKEKNRADTFSFNLDNKDKTMKKYEKEILEFRQKISILESKNQELLLDLQDSSQNSDDSVGLQTEKKELQLSSPVKLPEAFSRKSCLPTSHEQIEIALRELNNQKSITEGKKQEIKQYKERLRMCQEELASKAYSFMGIIAQLEQNNMILSDQIQVINENLAEREGDIVVHEQTMYELEEVKASKISLLNEIKVLYSEKDTIHKKYIETKEESFNVQNLLNGKDMTIRELELDLKVIKEKILAFEEKEKVYNMEIASLRRNSVNDPESQAVMTLERQIIALKNENSELVQRLDEFRDRSKNLVKNKEETIEKLQNEIKENKEKFNEELEVKTTEIMAQSEEAMNELFKQREQLAAKLQFERRNTMIGWQRAMSVKDPTLLVSEEIFKLREALVEKEKEIARVSKNNKDLKMCWKDSAKLLKAVWKQLGDETKKIEDAVKKRNH